MSKGEYFYIPECVATGPANGKAICERWWSVHPEKGVVFWFIPNGYFASEEPSPQCNPDETTARYLNSRGRSDCEVKFLPVVFMGHAIAEMKRIRKERNATRLAKDIRE